MINLISFKSMILDVSSIIDLNEIYRVVFYWSTLKNVSDYIVNPIKKVLSVRIS